VDPVQLAEQRPHPAGLFRHLEVEQLLDGKHEDELVVLERDVVDARPVRDAFPPRLVLHRLLEAGVEVTDDRADSDDLLAVEVDDEAQHAVRRRMVRAEVDLKDVAGLLELRRHSEDRRNRRGDARPRVDSLRGDDGHDRYSSPEKRTGSPPIG
jgi:hypothetical protein